MDKIEALGISSEIEENVAKENVRVIAEFPGLGNRLVSTVSSWLSLSDQIDSTARILAATNHALSIPYNIYWAMQVGSEYVGYSENLPAINTAITLAFNKVFGGLAPVLVKREGKEADMFDVRSSQIDGYSDYRRALKGLRTLCLVYRYRYLKDASKQDLLEQLMQTYATQYRAYCALHGLSGSKLEDHVRREIEGMRRENLNPSQQQRVIEPGFTEFGESQERQGVLHAIQGMHTEEEVESKGAKKEEIVFGEKRMLLHPQAMTDIQRTPITIAGEYIDRTVSANPLELMKIVLTKLAHTFGPEYSEQALAEMVQILAAQTFTAFIAVEGQKKFGTQEGLKEFALKMKEDSYASSILQEGNDIVFIKQVSFYKVDRNDPDLDFENLAANAVSVVDATLKIRIPKINFITNSFKTEDLMDVQIAYALNEHKK